MTPADGPWERVSVPAVTHPPSQGELFLGYDPGGENTHGVVSVTIAQDGTYGDMQPECLPDAAEVRTWLRQHPFAVALGIDTLLAWSWNGSRPCDNSLRQHYYDSRSITSINAANCRYCRDNLHELCEVQAKPKWRNSKSVVPQNSLYSAMTLNGALVAVEARKHRPELSLVESHPKLLLHAARGIGPARDHLVRGYAEALHKGRIARKDGRQLHEDHMADAFVAAWCASRWYFGQWTTDLYDLTSRKRYYFPVSGAVYPWPEAVGEPSSHHQW